MWPPSRIKKEKIVHENCFQAHNRIEEARVSYIANHIQKEVLSMNHTLVPSASGKLAQFNLGSIYWRWSYISSAEVVVGVCDQIWHTPPFHGGDYKRIGNLKYILNLLLIICVLCLSSRVQAQSRVKVTQNGKTVVTVQIPQNKHVTLKRHSVRRHVHTNRGRFRYHNHIRRFHNNKKHARSRCSYCRAYKRWKIRTSRRYSPIYHVCK